MPAVVDFYGGEWEVGDGDLSPIPTRTRRCDGRCSFGSITTGSEYGTGKVIRKSPKPEDRPEDELDMGVSSHRFRPRDLGRPGLACWTYTFAAALCACGTRVF